ncbi:MAG: family 1 glycosylhydrolase, partial [Flavobacteriales bacterium]|nr:family 1 glycosylhydrolase [Flavobacteriales bacterium]
NKEHANDSVKFYHHYREDLALMRSMHIRNFRFSLSWPRIIPHGTGKINVNGIDFYNRLIDQCLEMGIEPWVTLYHWDLPHHLELKGGWTNRDIIHWFADYAETCASHFGDRIKKWMVLNEPMVFTGAGYFMGVHAPGKRGLSNFLKAMHHAVLVQGISPEIIRYHVPDAEIGTTFSCSHLSPHSESLADLEALKRADVLLNRLFLEPMLGLEYPIADFRALERVHDFMGPRDELLMQGKYDFIGIQNYTREVVQSAWYIPYLKARLISAKKRNVHHTQMNWEVYPEAIYEMIKKYSSYPGEKKIYITENGAAFHDVVQNGRIHDLNRTNYLQSYLQQVLRAKNEGYPVSGYFVWSFTDNYEWAEGYTPKFGIVHVDLKTQKRIVKDSGLWYKSFLQNEGIQTKRKAGNQH